MLVSVVRSRGEPEQQLGGGVIDWAEAELVEDDQVVAEQVVDDLADSVVGPAVEGVDESSAAL
jgi:hypothetical protein